jgi:WD40 repeat protein
VEENVIIANRPKLYAKLMNVIAFDLDISSYDINVGYDLLALCAGKVVYLVKLGTWALIDKFGRIDGGAHKGNIKDVSLDWNCQYLASVGEDKRIAVWNIKKKVSEMYIKCFNV